MPEPLPRRPERTSAEQAKRAARDPELVSRVYGAPLEIDEVKLIPVAALRRCGRQSPDEREGNAGCGCVTVRPVGLVVIHNGRVSWKPAFDVNRLVLALAALSGLFLLLGRRRKR